MTRRRAILVGAFVLLGVAVLVGLGIWQLQRLAWKESLIEAAETRATAEAAPLPPVAVWPDLSPQDYEYRAVAVSGSFLHEHEVHAYTVLAEPRGAAGGQGYLVLTPLRLADGSGTVIVNRGFVPDARKAAGTRPEGQVEGTVEIEGLMRAPQPASALMPADDQARNVWFSRDPAAIAAAVGLEGPVAPFTIDQRAPLPPGGLPQPGETRLSFRNSHLGYAITWFGLAAALLLMYLAFLRTGRRERR